MLPPARPDPACSGWPAQGGPGSGVQFPGLPHSAGRPGRTRPAPARLPPAFSSCGGCPRLPQHRRVPPHPAHRRCQTGSAGCRYPPASRPAPAHRGWCPQWGSQWRGQTRPAGSAGCFCPHWGGPAAHSPPRGAKPPRPRTRQSAGPACSSARSVWRSALPAIPPAHPPPGSQSRRSGGQPAFAKRPGCPQCAVPARRPKRTLPALPPAALRRR